MLILAMEGDPMDAVASFVFKGWIAFGIIYAWTYSFDKPSKFRAGKAKNMKEEFAVYGLPAWSVPIMRVLKLSLALALLAGYFYQPLVKPVAGALTVIMFVAVMMHLKLRGDPLVRALPSYLLLCFSIFLILD